MDNDKGFALFTVVLIAGALCLVSVLVSTGIAELPAPWVFAEHVGLALLIRAAYKSLGAPTWNVFELWAEIRDRAVVSEAQAPATGAADAIG